MAKVFTVIGVIMVALGGLWVLQRLGYVGGSFMTGQTKWAIYGALLIVVGIALAVWSANRRP